MSQRSIMWTEKSEEPNQLTHLERTMVAITQLERDRYRNLQKKAKKLGIRANLKRKDMLAQLKYHYDQEGLAAFSQSTEADLEPQTEPGDDHLEAEYVPPESTMEQQPADSPSDEVVEPVLKNADVVMEETAAGSAGMVKSKEPSMHTEATKDIPSQLGVSLASQEVPGPSMKLRRRTVFITARLLPTTSDVAAVQAEQQMEAHTQETGGMVPLVAEKVDVSGEKSTACNPCVDQSIERAPSAETAKDISAQAEEDLGSEHIPGPSMKLRRRTVFISSRQLLTTSNAAAVQAEGKMEEQAQETGKMVVALVPEKVDVAVEPACNPCVDQGIEPESSTETAKDISAQEDEDLVSEQIPGPSMKLRRRTVFNSARQLPTTSNVAVVQAESKVQELTQETGEMVALVCEKVDVAVEPACNPCVDQCTEPESSAETAKDTCAQADEDLGAEQIPGPSMKLRRRTVFFSSRQLPTTSNVAAVQAEHTLKELTQETAELVTLVSEKVDVELACNTYKDQGIEPDPCAELAKDTSAQSGEDLASKRHAQQAPMTRRRRTCFKAAPEQPHVPVLPVVQPEKETDAGTTEAAALQSDPPAAETQPHVPAIPAVQPETDAGTTEAAALQSDTPVAEATTETRKRGKISLERSRRRRLSIYPRYTISDSPEPETSTSAAQASSSSSQELLTEDPHNSSDTSTSSAASCVENMPQPGPSKEPADVNEDDEDDSALEGFLPKPVTGKTMKVKNKKIRVVVELDPTLLCEPPQTSCLKTNGAKKDAKLHWSDESGQQPLVAVRLFAQEHKLRTCRAFGNVL